MTPEEKREVRERLEKATPAEQLALSRYDHGGGRLASPPDWLTNAGSNRELVADFYDEANREFYVAAPTDIRNLLAHIDEVEADNAALLAAIVRPIVSLDDDPHDPHECVNCHQTANAKYNLIHEPGCISVAEHPGTALLARHAEELAAKDKENQRLQKELEAVWEAVTVKAAEFSESQLKDWLEAAAVEGADLHRIIVLPSTDVAARDAEIARLREGLTNGEERERQLMLSLTLMHFAGMKVRCCWRSPNVFDRNYSAGAIQGTATCDCMPCKEYRREHPERYPTKELLNAK